MPDKIIDWALAAKLAGDNPEFAKELLGMLAEALPEHEEEISTAFNAQDLKTLTSATHKLHGATCYTGTPRLKEAAKTLEQNAKENANDTKIKTAYETLQKEMQSFQEELDRHV